MRRLRSLDVVFAYERQLRTNDLRVSICSASVGTTF